MLSKLSTKLLLPNLAIGLAFIFGLFFISDTVSKFTLAVIFTALVILQSLVSYFFFNQMLTKRLVRLKAYLDMVVSIEEAPSEPLKDPANDDLAQVTNDLSHFIVDLADVVNVIRQESEVLRQGSTSLSLQMSDSVALVEKSTEQISQMAESIEDVTNTSSSLSKSAEQVSETTSSVMEILAKGVNSSNTSQETIEAVASEVGNMAKELALLQEESARIGSVLDVIRGIAEQTNLLALNAAIEAARAGDQGRGFAVVADEVRALAHRTQESTVEIQAMVEGLQAKTTNAVNSMSKGHKLTQDSLNYSAEVVSALEQIGYAFQDVDNLTSQIASTTLAQQSATSSINDTMLAVVSLSHDINSGLNSVAAHAEQQQQTSKEVEQTINRICV
ncbi:MAG: methyl-accepting chemotaxis protein [Colwellia sp.]|nr:methyl-accepting chemotaxis protein [Colwellia sp.]